MPKRESADCANSISTAASWHYWGARKRTYAAVPACSYRLPKELRRIHGRQYGTQRAATNSTKNGPLSRTLVLVFPWSSAAIVQQPWNGPSGASLVPERRPQFFTFLRGQIDHSPSSRSSDRGGAASGIILSQGCRLISQTPQCGCTVYYLRELIT